MTDSGGTLFEKLLFTVVVAAVGYLVYLVLFPFLVPLVWAAVFATVLDRLQERLERRIGRTRASLATTLLAALLVLGPAVFLLSILVREMPQLAARVQQASVKAPDQVERIWATARERLPLSLPENPAQLIGQGMQRALGFLAGRAGAALADLFATVGSLFVFLFALFFLLRDRDQVAVLILGLMPFRERESRVLLGDTRDLVIASVGAGLAVAAAQGAIGAIAFWMVGIGAPAIWGVVMAIASLIPLVGAALVWVPTAVWLIVSGEVARGIFLALIGVLGISMADNVLRPLLLSDKASANGLVVFLGLLGGASAFGFIGLVIGPIVLITAGSMLRMFTQMKEE
jgi:predicted PurR-regulated permease PerM